MWQNTPKGYTGLTAKFRRIQLSTGSIEINAASLRIRNTNTIHCRFKSCHAFIYNQFNSAAMVE